MARITPNQSASAEGNKQNKEREEKLSAGKKICTMLGHFFEIHNNNKKLHIGYAVIEDYQADREKTEVGHIHIDTLLIRDTVMWKHQKWSGGCGFNEAYDNEDSEDITKIILNCPAVEIDLQIRSWEWNGQERSSMEINEWRKLDDYNIENKLNLISKLEEAFEKIVDYRVRRGDNITRSTATAKPKQSNDGPNADFDNYVNNNNDIPF